MTDDEQKSAVHNWMQMVEGRILTLENLLIELLVKFKDAGLIVDVDDDADADDTATEE